MILKIKGFYTYQFVISDSMIVQCKSAWSLADVSRVFSDYQSVLINFKGQNVCNTRSMDATGAGAPPQNLPKHTVINLDHVISTTTIPFLYLHIDQTSLISVMPLLIQLDSQQHGIHMHSDCSLDPLFSCNIEERVMTQQTLLVLLKIL